MSTLRSLSLYLCLSCLLYLYLCLYLSLCLRLSLLPLLALLGEHLPVVQHVVVGVAAPAEEVLEQGLQVRVVGGVLEGQGVQVLEVLLKLI